MLSFQKSSIFFFQFRRHSTIFQQGEERLRKTSLLRNCVSYRWRYSLLVGTFYSTILFFVCNLYLFLASFNVGTYTGSYPIKFNFVINKGRR